ncbi:MAG TPA: hypothetical protein PLE30_00305 [Candidatus Kapabacteria bacterium]|nr:hypothetical protein [Candidatus Kapabacteria bacterium]
MHLKFYLTLFLSVIILASCSSVNNLKNYDLHGKKIYFDEIVGKDANTVRIEEEPNYDNNKSDNKNSTEKVLDAIGSIGTSIGKALTESDVRDKLDKNSNPKMVIDAISSGIEKTLVQYLNISAENNINGDYDFIVTTTLEELSLRSGTNGVYISARAMCTITSRKDGKIVWQETETESVKLRSNSTYGADSKLLKNISQISSLASLSDGEIRNAITNAANEVGRSIANDLREDISELKK